MFVIMYGLAYILVVAAIVANAKKLPSYIVPCKSNDPNLNECAKQHAIRAIPHILKGDAEYKIPVMLPLKIPKIIFNPYPDFTLILNNISLSGLDTVQVEDYRVNLEKNHGEAMFYIKRLVLEGQYEMKGRVLILPIEGEGPARIACDDLAVNFVFDYKLITKDGTEYIDEHNFPAHVSYNVTNISVNFGNLFNGDKNLGDRTNEFLNEHSLEINKDFEPTISRTIELVAADIYKKIIAVVPYNEMFIF